MLVFGDVLIVGVIKPVSSKSFLSKYPDGFVGRNIGKQGCQAVWYEYVVSG